LKYSLWNNEYVEVFSIRRLINYVRVDDYLSGNMTYGVVNIETGNSMERVEEQYIIPLVKRDVQKPRNSDY
jgi:hypothetical protein